MKKKTKIKGESYYKKRKRLALDLCKLKESEVKDAAECVSTIMGRKLAGLLLKGMHIVINLHDKDTLDNRKDSKRWRPNDCYGVFIKFTITKENLSRVVDILIPLFGSIEVENYSNLDAPEIYYIKVSSSLRSLKLDVPMWKKEWAKTPEGAKSLPQNKSP
jgi:hypothetical protein